MPRCITIVNYKIRNNPIFIVEHLSDILFQMGFRVLNPDFKATWQQIEDDRNKITDLLQKSDPLNANDNYQPNHKISPRQRYLFNNPGMDTSTKPKVF